MSTATIEAKKRTGRVVEVRNLVKYFPVTGGIFKRTIGQVRAVDDVSFYINANETLGLVGESGCGKTTTGRVILRLLPPTAGTVLFGGQNVFDLDSKSMRSLRKEMQIIFQDPYASLNPRQSIGEIIGKGLRAHGMFPTGREKRIKELLSIVGLAPRYINRYPHEFSGGQRQRIGIARALAVEPKLVVCDEAVSALDVSIQAQIINLMQDLQQEFKLTYLFIAHDLSIIKHVSDRIAVMYLGKIAEVAKKNELYENPLHPYTKALLSAIPVPDPELRRERIILEGDVPSPANPPPGCRFHTRCPRRMDICSQKEPEQIDHGEEHFVSCHLYTRQESVG